MPQPIMSVEQRAAQLWPLLAYAAARHQLLTYGEVGKLIGVAARGLGKLLEPVQSYCLLRKLPPLTAIVVRRNTGRPGEGFSAVSDPTQEQHQVFAFDWLGHPSPAPAVFAAAVSVLPSCGGFNVNGLDVARQKFEKILCDMFDRKRDSISAKR